MNDTSVSVVDVHKPRVDWPRLALGTVQFGYPYGVSQCNVARKDIGPMLAHAWKCGVDVLDTAPVYGESEAAIGQEMPPGAEFGCITKTVALRLENISKGDVERVIDRARRSAKQLRMPTLDGILVHESEDLLCPGSDHLMAGLRKLRDEGLIKKIGVSVYDPATLETILDRHDVEIVQLPLNVFDQRFVQGEYPTRLAARGIEVHVRSVFLQGLLVHDSDRIPLRFLSAAAKLARFHDRMASIGLSPIEGAILFASSQSGVSRLVIGVDSIASLEADTRALAKAATLTASVDFSEFALDDPSITDPRRWTV